MIHERCEVEGCGNLSVWKVRGMNVCHKHRLIHDDKASQDD